MTATESQRALLASLLEAHPKLLEAEALVARQARRRATDALHRRSAGGPVAGMGRVSAEQSPRHPPCRDRRGTAYASGTRRADRRCDIGNSLGSESGAR